MELQCLEISETDWKKSLILPNAIGREGSRVLRTKGYDNLTSSESPLKYDELVGALNDFLAHEKTSNVKTKTFVSVSQLTGEHNHSYLRELRNFPVSCLTLKLSPSIPSRLLQP